MHFSLFGKNRQGIEKKSGFFRLGVGPDGQKIPWKAKLVCLCCCHASKSGFLITRPKHWMELIIDLESKGLETIFWRKIVNIFLPINFNICFGCSNEPSQWDGSFEYPQHMFWLRNKKVNFLVRTLNYRPERANNKLNILDWPFLYFHIQCFDFVWFDSLHPINNLSVI